MFVWNCDEGYMINMNVRTESKFNIMAEAIKTVNAAQPLGAYPHARRVGNLLFLSGIGSRSPKDNTIPGLVLSKKRENKII